MSDSAPLSPISTDPFYGDSAAQNLAFPQNFGLDVLCASQVAQQNGIDNRPPSSLWPNLHALAWGLAQVEALLQQRLQINSGYRCGALNACVGGVSNSQHLTGLAADFTCPAFGDPLAVAQAIAASSIAFDQLILEFGRWVHLSFSLTQPRHALLTLRNNQEGYLDGLVR